MKFRMKLNETSAKYIGFTLLLIVILSLLTTVALDSRDDVADRTNTQDQVAAAQVETQTTLENSNTTASLPETTVSDNKETQDTKIFVSPTSPQSNLIKSAKILNESFNFFGNTGSHTIPIKLQIKTDPAGTSFPVQVDFNISVTPHGQNYMKTVKQSSTDNGGIASTSVNVTELCGHLSVTAFLRWDGGTLMVPGSVNWSHQDFVCSDHG